jgi:hypothetical protein
MHERALADWVLEWHGAWCCYRKKEQTQEEAGCNSGQQRSVNEEKNRYALKEVLIYIYQSLVCCLDGGILLVIQVTMAPSSTYLKVRSYISPCLHGWVHTSPREMLHQRQVIILLMSSPNDITQKVAHHSPFTSYLLQKSFNLRFYLLQQ